MSEFDETKRLLDEINAAISGYDPILKEHARDILLKSVFGTETQGSDDSRSRPQKATEGSGSPTKKRVLTLKEYAVKWTPRTGYDRSLLCLYYLRSAFGLRSPTGRQLNRELQENGLGVPNITVAMLENVRLLRAQSKVIRGTKGTRQSRNEYAITDFGIQYVESRLNLNPLASR